MGKLRGAYLLGLLLSFLLASVVIAVIGVSEVGELAIGPKGTATGWANTTVWNTYASVGGSVWILGFVVALVILIILIVYLTPK